MRRYRTLKNGYVIDRWLMLAMYAPLFLLGLGAFAWSVIHGFQGVSCDDYRGCENPYYGLCDDYELCGLETLPTGYSYNVPPLLFSDAMTLPMVLFALGFFVINHVKHNKGYNFGL